MDSTRNLIRETAKTLRLAKLLPDSLVVDGHVLSWAEEHQHYFFADPSFAQHIVEQYTLDQISLKLERYNNERQLVSLHKRIGRLEYALELIFHHENPLTLPALIEQVAKSYGEEPPKGTSV